MHDTHGSALTLSPWSAARTIAHFGGDEKLVRELVALFLASCPRHRDRLRARFREGDLAGLGRAAHAIKGSLSNFTTEAPATTALELEGLCSLGDREAADAKLERLERELDALVAAMQTFQTEGC